MEDCPGLLVTVFQLAVLPVVVGYVVYRMIGGARGALVGLGAAIGVVVWFAVNLAVPDK